jgi:hypothetical protein
LIRSPLNEMQSQMRILNSYSILRALFIISLGLLLDSCGKDSIFDLFQSSGPVVKEQREVNRYIDKVSVYDNINLVISQGPATSITVEGGSNLLSDVTTEIGEDSMLTLRNNNKYDWVRSYDKKITVYLQINRLRIIRYESTGDITTMDTIRQDSLRIDAWGGSGKITMTIDCGTLWLTMRYGTMDFDFSGKSGVTYIMSGSYGPFHCLGLKSHSAFVTSKGTNDCYVNAIDRIEADISSLGNVYYTGDPPIVSVNRTGAGQLVHLR